MLHHKEEPRLGTTQPGAQQKRLSRNPSGYPLYKPSLSGMSRLLAGISGLLFNQLNFCAPALTPNFPALGIGGEYERC